MVEQLHTPLPYQSSPADKERHYAQVIGDLQLVLQEEPDWVAAMATVSSVLHQAFDYFHWTGFYCVWPHTGPNVLVVGPYQGTLGCLRIPFNRGVCGAAAATQQTQLVPDVHAFPGHIACASSTQSEVVVPVVVSPPSTAQPAPATADQEHPGEAQQQQQQQQANPQSSGGITTQGGRLLAVLDVDSNHPAAFDVVDAKHLEQLCTWLAHKYAAGAAAGAGDAAGSV